MLVFIYGNVGKLQWRLKFDQDFQAEVWSRFRCWTLVKILKLDFDLVLKRIESSFFSERNRSDRKGDFALCCSALPILIPTLQSKRLLPFDFFYCSKVFFRSHMKLVYFALVLRKPLFHCNCKSAHTENNHFWCFFVQQICFSMSICPCIC